MPDSVPATYYPLFIGSIGKAPDSKARAGSLLRRVVVGNIRGCPVSPPVKMKFFVVRFG